jgi:hypothetical protein
MALNKEKQYAEVYFPEKMIDDKEEAYGALLDIDSNFSKFLQGLLKQIIIMSKVILSYGKNYRHFEWIILVKDKKSGKVFACEDIPKDYRKVTEDDV